MMFAVVQSVRGVIWYENTRSGWSELSPECGRCVWTKSQTLIYTEAQMINDLNINGKHRFHTLTKLPSWPHLVMQTYHPPISKISSNKTITLNITCLRIDKMQRSHCKYYLDHRSCVCVNCHWRGPVSLFLVKSDSV